MLNYSAPVSGADVARAAWDLDETLLARLMPGVSAPTDIHDARAQFSLWACAQSTVQFPTFAHAWNTFITPGGSTRPAVYLPGSPCERCRGRRFNAADLGRGGYANCAVCKGTGRKPPRALPATLATVIEIDGTADLAATGTHG